ncbi:MAG: NAD(P)H-dependent oxidoreductase subunit E [Erysipelotrichales bacterium]|nr:NAD(P)H-dependent oxidoreductase subunit E [Erysipelotrichales bacterium]
MAAKVEITKEKIAELKKVIETNKKKPGPLMPTLHEAQRIFGCIPLPVQKIVSDGLKMSVAEVNGVVTFYSNFTLEPMGQNIVSVCMGTACYVKGAQEILDEISKIIGVKPGETGEDGKFTLNATRCIGACGLAPLFTVGEDVYGSTTLALTKEQIKKYL